MRILDRYICRKFVLNLLFALVSFILIFIVVNLVEQLSDFIDKQVPPAVVALYYLHSIPEIVTLTLPIGMMVATMFSIGQLSKYNELLAMKASGISLYRMFMPLYLTALIASLLMIAFVEFVVPYSNSQRAELKGRHIDKLARYSNAQVSNIYIQHGEDTRIFISSYNEFEKSARSISVQTYDGALIRKRMDAKEMRWEKDQWVLKNIHVRHFNGKSVSYDSIGSKPFEGFEIGPAELGHLNKDPHEMNYRELKEFTEDVRKNGGDPNQWLVDLYLKISFPFAGFIIVLFGAPLAATRVRATGAAGFVISLLTCFLYFIFVKAAQTLGQTAALEPMLAAWLGNLVFFVASLGILLKAPK